MRSGLAWLFSVSRGLTAALSAGQPNGHRKRRVRGGVTVLWRFQKRSTLIKPTVIRYVTDYRRFCDVAGATRTSRQQLQSALSGCCSSFSVRLERRFSVPACTTRERRAERRSRLAAGHRRRRREAVLTVASTARGLIRSEATCAAGSWSRPACSRAPRAAGVQEAAKWHRRDVPARNVLDSANTALCSTDREDALHLRAHGASPTPHQALDGR